jgi:MOSC domain-containing protein
MLSLHGVASLASIHIYPLKSCAPLALDRAVVEERGLVGDRRWMVIDAADRFLTGRQQPRLTLIAAVPDGDALRLSAPGMPDLCVTAPAGERIATAVWGTAVRPLAADAAAHEWISSFLGAPCRIVHMDDACTRPVTTAHDSDRDTVAEVSFADGFPLLLISQAALDALNARLQAPVPILRFRPNLVVAGTAAHAEDGWKRIRVGAVEFDVVKPCTRCVFTTVDFERGAFDPSGEPLRTLIGYRRTPDGVAFGQNLIPRGGGTIRVGDPVEVLAARG